MKTSKTLIISAVLLLLLGVLTGCNKTNPLNNTGSDDQTTDPVTVTHITLTSNSFSNITDHSVSVLWQLSSQSASWLEYGETVANLTVQQVSQAPLSVYNYNLTALKANTVYYVVICHRDSDGTTVIKSAPVSFSTSADQTAPDISSLTVASAGSKTLISWQTNEPYTVSTLFYTTNNFSTSTQAQAAYDPTLKKYTAQLENLSVSTEYAFRITMTDENANQTIQTKTFKTVDIVYYSDPAAAAGGKVYIDTARTAFRQDVSSNSGLLLKARIGLITLNLSEISGSLASMEQELSNSYYKRLQPDFQDLIDRVKQVYAGLDFTSVSGLATTAKGYVDIYVQFKAEIDAYLQNFANSTNNELMTLSSSVFSKAQLIQSDLDELGEQMDIMMQKVSQAPADTVTVYIDGSGGDIVFKSSDIAELKGKVDSIKLLFEQSLGDRYHLLFEGLKTQTPYTSGNKAALIADMTELNNRLSDLEVLFTSYPFSKLNIPLDPLYGLMDFNSDLMDFLNGYEYDIYEKKIKPSAWIDNPVDGPKIEKMIAEFYSKSNADMMLYTFGGLFPQGLPADFFAIMEPDIYYNPHILNSAPGGHLKAVLDARYNAFVSALPRGDAEVGLALVKVIRFGTSYDTEFPQIFNLLKSGNIAGANNQFDLQKYYREIREIRAHIANAAQAPGPYSFTVVVNDNDAVLTDVPDPAADHSVKPLPIMKIQVQAVDLMADGLEGVLNTAETLWKNFNYDISRIFITELDPNSLDFSTVNMDNPLTIFDALKAANPEFLKPRPDADAQLDRIKANMVSGLQQLKTDIANVQALSASILTVPELANNPDIDKAAITAEFTKLTQVTDDMLSNLNGSLPYVTFSDGTRINFNAWFTTTPDDLLAALKAFLQDPSAAGSLGGIFPLGIALGQ